MREAEPHVEDGEQGLRRFVPPWWTWLMPVVVLLGTAAWVTANADAATAGAFIRGMLWPGSAAFAATVLMVWLGWVLEID